MSQHDMDVANGAGVVVRADINAALQALASLSSGSSAPSPSFPCQIWADTGTSRLKRRNAANSAWLDEGPLDAALRDAALQGGFVADTGTANAYVCNFVPTITARSESTPLRFKVANANTTASTINDGVGVVALVGAAHAALQGGELTANGIAWIQWNASVGGGSYVLLFCTGAPQQVADATKAKHAVTAGQLVTQSMTAFTTAGTAPSFTLTPSPAITAYAAGQRFRVKFHAAGAGSDTLNVSALGTKAFKQYDASGTKVAAVIASGQLTDVEYDGTDLVILDPLPATPRQIQPITASVAANALTLTLNPTGLDFRSATLGSGAVNSRIVPSAISLVVPSGATLGTANAVANRLVLIAIDNSGTVELAVGNLSGGVNLDETTLISTTAISAGATAANVIYSTTARTNVPFRVVGFKDSTQATAGTWATAPSTIQGAGGQALAALSAIGYGQPWQTVTGSRALGTTYTNTTGKPIQVNVALQQAGTGGPTMLVNGTVVDKSFVSPSVNGKVSAIVQPGSTYSVPAGAWSLDLWAEMRS